MSALKRAREITARTSSAEGARWAAALVLTGWVITASSMAQACPGDCNGDGRVSVAELVVGVNQSLGLASVQTCDAFDLDADGVVTVAELIAAVAAAVDGCPAAATPTPTLTPSLRTFTPNVSFEQQEEVLALVSTYSATPGIILISPDGRHVYVMRDNSEQLFQVFERDPVTGDTTFLRMSGEGIPIVGSTYPPSAAISPDGRHIYAMRGSSNRLATLHRDEQSGTLQLQALDDLDFGTKSIAVSPDGLFVYTASLTLRRHARDPESGALSLIDSVSTQRLGRLVTTSPDGSRVFVISHHPGALDEFAVDGSEGMRHVQVLVSEFRDPLYGLVQVRSFAVSPDGRFVYTANGKGRKIITTIGRDESTGAFEVVDVYEDGNNPLWSMAMSPDGEYVYVSSFSIDEGFRYIQPHLLVMRRDHTRGPVVPVQAAAIPSFAKSSPPSLSWVAVSPDGRHVYVTDSTGLSVFRVLPESG